MQRGYLITIFLLLLALLFAIQNTESISLKFAVWDFTGSQALITVIIFSLGFFAGLLFAWRNIWKKNTQIRTLKKKIEEQSRLQQTNPDPGNS